MAVQEANEQTAERPCRLILPSNHFIIEGRQSKPPYHAVVRRQMPEGLELRHYGRGFCIKDTTLGSASEPELRQRTLDFEYSQPVAENRCRNW